MSDYEAKAREIVDVCLVDWGCPSELGHMMRESVTAALAAARAEGYSAAVERCAGVLGESRRLAEKAAQHSRESAIDWRTVEACENAIRALLINQAPAQREGTEGEAQ